MGVGAAPESYMGYRRWRMRSVSVWRRMGLRLQILVSAARQWDAAGHPLCLVNMGEEFRAELQRLRVDPAHFESEVTA